MNKENLFIGIFACLVAFQACGQISPSISKKLDDWGKYDKVIISTYRDVNSQEVTELTKLSTNDEADYDHLLSVAKDKCSDKGVSSPVIRIIEAKHVNNMYYTMSSVCQSNGAIL